MLNVNEMDYLKKLLSSDFCVLSRQSASKYIQIFFCFCKFDGFYIYVRDSFQVNILFHVWSFKLFFYLYEMFLFFKIDMCMCVKERERSR